MDGIVRRPVKTAKAACDKDGNLSRCRSQGRRASVTATVVSRLPAPPKGSGAGATGSSFPAVPERRPIRGSSVHRRLRRPGQTGADGRAADRRATGKTRLAGTGRHGVWSAAPKGRRDRRRRGQPRREER
ncbi:hypothetical protein SI859A1_03508 [Aurantimonas manganoxydans SI85-9A1]|uniref:Uncharacterized protein n=1 Tax=Aurantimonas manganoxydans (strain ATCC BAA-1229 / DSM 21871 / SI85-9A1) TaxID=287752 RepID=Q1YEM5_AURMS|nr:hypothetical protein SI859A1_03508 [Aurantimonas manganoxydans SI85-9A1]